MPVRVDIQRTGTFTKLADKTTIIGELPPRLNEDPNLYGQLREEMDLRLGCEDWKDPGWGDQFDSFFDYLKKTTEKRSSLRETLGADFVSNRRNIMVIAKSAFEIKPMNIQAIKKDGVIFLCDKDPEKSSFYINSTSETSGHKFERYLTLKRDGEPFDKYEKLTTDECSKAVFRTTVSSGSESIKLLYAAEIDAMDSKGNFVEMKATGICYTKWLERRSLSDYLQSYFAGVSYILYGRKVFRDWHFINRVDKQYTSSIPKCRVKWNKEKCFEQLFNVLNKIKSKLEYDDDALVLKLTEGGVFFEPECSKNCTFMNQDFFNHFE